MLFFIFTLIFVLIVVGYMFTDQGPTFPQSYLSFLKQNFYSD